MLAGLQVLQAGEPFDFAIRDVDSDPTLERRYGEQVPMLTHGNHELCHFQLEQHVVTDYLSKFR